MDTQPFNITFPDMLEKPEEDEFEPLIEEYDPVEMAYEMFYRTYGLHYPNKNIWTIQLGETMLSFDINDIFFIWNELPDLLTQSMNPSSQKWGVSFCFLEQWTQLVLRVTERDEHAVFVTVIDAYKNTEQPPIPISKKDFVTEWRAFAEHLVKLFVEHGFIAEDNLAIVNYFGRMPSV
ncbi:MAG: hypothetical protein BroJett018_39680 [Chloroflexota bacterium]|nr:MAG: hypothetical protein BroJett018_39680 [Chloroflexota bacterium]